MAVLAIAAGFVAAWQLGWLTDRTWSAEVAWQRGVSAPGIPGASSVPVASAQVSEQTVAVWVGGDVVLLDRESGELDGSVESFGPPVLLDDHLAVQGSSGLAVYDIATQSQAQGLGPVRAVGGAGSLLAFHGPPGLLTAYDVASRGLTQIRWQTEIPEGDEAGAARPVVIPHTRSSDGIVVTAVGRQVFRFAYLDGQRVWSTGVPGPSPIRDVVVAPDVGMVYAMDDDRNLTALDMTDGARRWQLPNVRRRPHAAGGVLVVDRSDGEVAVFDAATGEGPLWTAPGELADAAPVVSGDEVVMADGIDLVGLALDDGTERWRLQLLGSPSGITPSPDGTTFVVVPPGIVYAIDDGETVWRTIGSGLARNRTNPTVMAGGGVLVAQEPSGGWQALDAATGRQVWTHESDSLPAVSPPNVSGAGVFYIAENDLVALDTPTGQERWRVTPGFINPARRMPTTDGSTVVAGMGPVVIAVDAETGDERWRHAFRTPTHGVTATIDEQAVFAAADSGLLARLELSSGEVVWELEAGPSFLDPPLVAGGTVAVRGNGGTLRGFNAETGRASWRSDFTVDDLSVRGANGSLFVLRDENTVAAIDAETGSQTWTFEVDDHVLLTAPAIIGSTAVVASSDGTVYGLDDDGTQRWSLELDSPVLVAPSTADGHVFVAHVDGRITALTSDN